MAKQLNDSQTMPRDARHATRLGRRDTSRGHRRRGHITTLLLFSMPIGLLFAALVINWVFASTTNRRYQHLSDTFALSSAFTLLDEETLMDMPPDDTDDQADAAAEVDMRRMQNNGALATRWQLDASHVLVSVGRVEDVTMPVMGANFDEMPMPACDGATSPCSQFNTVRVKIERPRSGANPFELMFRQFQGAPSVVDQFTVSYATLDSRLTGFAPEAARPTPLVPLAILDSAWFTDRPAAMDDTTNANGRFELDIDLNDDSGGNSSGSLAAPNGALLDFDDAGPIDFAAMPGQITGGVVPADLAGGMITAHATSPFMNVGTQTTPSGPPSTAIIAAFNTVAASADPRRIFPIYDSFGGGEANLIGFVGATVLSASDIGAGNDQIRVRVEPNFIIHCTATTDPAVDENLYIHKIRLTR